MDPEEDGSSSAKPGTHGLPLYCLWFLFIWLAPVRTLCNCLQNPDLVWTGRQHAPGYAELAAVYHRCANDRQFMGFGLPARPVQDLALGCLVHLSVMCASRGSKRLLVASRRIGYVLFQPCALLFMERSAQVWQTFLHCGSLVWGSGSVESGWFFLFPCHRGGINLGVGRKTTDMETILRQGVSLYPRHGSRHPGIQPTFAYPEPPGPRIYRPEAGNI